MNKYTSLKLSKLLTDNGFEGECDNSQDSFGNLYDNGLKKKVKVIRELDLLPAYDILNDLCIKYAKEMFGEKSGCPIFFKYGSHYHRSDECASVECCEYEYRSSQVLLYLQQNKKDEAEEYIWEHCLFNKNKL